MNAFNSFWAAFCFRLGNFHLLKIIQNRIYMDNIQKLWFETTCRWRKLIIQDIDIAQRWTEWTMYIIVQRLLFNILRATRHLASSRRPFWMLSFYIRSPKVTRNHQQLWPRTYGFLQPSLCLLMAWHNYLPSHYLKQYWTIVNTVQWQW